MRVPIWLTLAAIVAAGCGVRRPPLQPVSLPDLSRSDSGVQAQARDAFDALTQKIAARGTPLDALADAYGAFGMVMNAAEYYEAAEPAYLDAQTLAPSDVRWPYYLAGIYKSTGNTANAEASYKRVLALRPDDLATLVYLGRLYLDEGRGADAEPLFTRALNGAPRTSAALAGLGRVALERRDYAKAAKAFEDALAADPEAESVHAQLAAAYRGLGEPEKAEPHLRQWRNRDVYVPDPLGQQLDLLLESGLSYELRGIRAFESRDWKLAAGFFRKGLTLSRGNTPLARSLHHKLGTALYLEGDTTGAMEQFEEVARLAPAEGTDESTSRAHYSLGLMLEDRGQHAPALEHLAAAVKYQPNYVEARLAYADALRRSGDFKTALAQYDEALAIDPRSSPARLGHALALAALGRWTGARDWLSQAMAEFPDRQEYASALARLLAASPDPRARDGRRALEISNALVQRQRTTDAGEALAMALAELGDFDQAIGIQRGVLAAAEQAKLTASVDQMTRNLQLYERRQPSRSPWPPDEPLVLVQSAAGSIADAAPR